jgi:uncharacterized Ntn-hydrolase superfamily protein
MKYLLLFLSLFLCVRGAAQDTFSIVAVDPATGEVGSAGASCLDNIGFPGSNGAIIISDLLPGRGAIHTQSFWNATNQTNARARMQEGLAPADVIQWLRQNDVEGSFGQLKRQYGVVDFDPQGQPRSAAFTGSSCFDWKGHRTGSNYAIQGNILLGPQILDSMEQRFLSTEGQPLHARLMYAMQGAKVVGADTRCAANGTSSLSAFVRVAGPADTLGVFTLDLNVPSLPAGREPIDSLQTLYDAWVTIPTTEPALRPARLFPNPARHELVVFWENTDAAQVQIIDRDGRVTYERVLQRGQNRLVPSMATSGVYFVRITAGTRVVQTEKLVWVPRD